MSVKSCILLICGIPASGKSELSLKFKKFFRNHSSVYIISIDKLMSIEEQSIVAQESGEWKRFRNDILSAADFFIRKVLKIGNANSNLSEKCANIYQNICMSNDLTIEGRDFLLIVDDNLYYKSMRYQWYHIAKHHHMGYAQIIIDCPLETALHRNRERCSNEMIPDDIIIKMHERFECSDMSGFESKTLTLTVNTEVSDDTVEFIIDALNDPIMGPDCEERDALRAQSKAITLSNVIHQTDCVLRDSIRAKINQIQWNNKSEIAKSMSEAKRSLLIQIKNGAIILPDDVSKAIVSESETNEKAKEFLMNLLEKELLKHKITF